MIPVQAVSPFVEKLLDGKIFDAVVDVFTASVPQPIVALAVFGSIGIGYYLVQQRVIIPVVMFAIVGGTTLGLAPAAYNNAILAGFGLALAGVGYIILNRVRV